MELGEFSPCTWPTDEETCFDRENGSYMTSLLVTRLLDINDTSATFQKPRLILDRLGG